MKLTIFIFAFFIIGAYSNDVSQPPKGLRRLRTQGGTSIFRDPNYDHAGNLINSVKDTGTTTAKIVAKKIDGKMIGQLGERCTRSGKCIKTFGDAFEKISSNTYNYIDKIAPTISVAVAVNEAYDDYKESKSKVRFVLTATNSFLKNWAVSSGTIYVAAACGTVAPLCAVGGTLAVLSYTPSGKDFTNIILGK
jgi:hypothetical protein